MHELKAHMHVQPASNMVNALQVTVTPQQASLSRSCVLKEAS